jgi:hypothetical protein
MKLGCYQLFICVFFVSTYLKAHTAVNLGEIFSVRGVCIYKAHALCLKTFGKFVVSKANRCTEFQFYWYYDSTGFGQSFCPSSGVLSRTSALVQFMQFGDRVLPGAGSILLLYVPRQEVDNLSTIVGRMQLRKIKGNRSQSS